MIAKTKGGLKCNKARWICFSLLFYFFRQKEETNSTNIPHFRQNKCYHSWSSNNLLWRLLGGYTVSWAILILHLILSALLLLVLNAKGPLFHLCKKLMCHIKSVQLLMPHLHITYNTCSIHPYILIHITHIYVEQRTKQKVEEKKQRRKKIERKWDERGSCEYV